MKNTKNMGSLWAGFRRSVIIGAVACFSVMSWTALGAFSGDSSGTFVNPVGPAGIVVTGVGTSHFTWGTGIGGGPSSLDYNHFPFSGVPAETSFLLGTLTYFNGTIAGGSEANTVDLNLAVNFTDPSGISHSFLYGLQLINTPNTGDPIASADYVILSSFPTTRFDVGGISY